MQVFMVERSLKGISMNDLGAAQKAAISTAGEMSRSGTAVKYIRSTFVPETGCCMGACSRPATRPASRR
jgi:hypothetical protein